MIFIGLDVHVRNSYLHVADAEGKLLKRGRVGNSPGELSQFLEFLGDLPRQPVRAVLESTTNSRAVHRMLGSYAEQAGVQMSAQVLDARKLRIIAESVSKCDKLDAAVLAELARSNLKLPACYMPDDEVFALREHLRSRSDLVKMRTMLKNRVHAVLHRRGIASLIKDVFTKEGRAWLKGMKIDEAGREILDRYLEMVDRLDEVIADSTADLRKLAASDRWRKPAAILRTMPGVGLITSLVILAELGDIQRFHGRAAVSNYAGLVPVVRDSNNKHFGGGITHRGSSHLRATMVESAWTGVARAPQYAALFHRVSGRRGKQVAIVAVARRMLEDAWTMLKKEEVFRLMSGEMDERIGQALQVSETSVDSSVAG